MEIKSSNTSNANFVNPTSVRVSKDRRYLIIALPGNRIARKPLAYYRAILDNNAHPSETGATALPQPG